MTSKLNAFAVLYSKVNWQQYKHEMASQLSDGQPNLSHPGALGWPGDPKSFPCLVASMMTPVDPTKANNFCHYKMNCCFVYADDAARLMEAKAQLDQSIVVEEEPDIPDYEEAEEQYAPTQTGVLLLALVNELEAIGALKRDKLLAELKLTEQWLIDNQSDNVEDNSLSATLQRMWRDKDAR